MHVIRYMHDKTILGAILVFNFSKYKPWSCLLVLIIMFCLHTYLGIKNTDFRLSRHNIFLLFVLLYIFQRWKLPFGVQKSVLTQYGNLGYQTCVRCRPSYNIFLKHLIWNRSLGIDQTSQEWPLECPYTKVV